jgi:hypothetical protein
MTEDFTLLPEGSVVVLEGTVSRCPTCGRNGVLKEPDGAPAYCIHVEVTIILADGMRTDPTDCCEIAKA